MSLGKQQRDLIVRIDAETKGFEGGLQRSSAALRSMRAELRQLEARQAKNHQSMEKVGRAGVAMGAAMAAGVALSVRAASQWESAWAGVTKTVDGSASQMAALEVELRNLAKTLPVTHQEIAGIAEAAGQLGVKREAIAGFTKVVIDLANTTDLSFDAAATSLAQFANIMRISHADFDRVGSALVALGNNGASTESQIVDMALRLAGAGSRIGATGDEVLALSSSMADLGIQSELGGGAMSRVLLKMYEAAQQGGEAAQGFADLAGMSAQQFAESFGTDPVQALDAVVQGLGRVKDEGGNVVGALSDVGIEGTHNLQVMLALAGAGDGLTRSLVTSAEALEANTALTEEANKRYETTESRAKIARNAVNDLGITLGSTLLPAVGDAVDAVGDLAKWLGELPAPAQTAFAIVGTLGATVGLLGGAALIAIPKLAAMRTALDTLGVSAGRTETIVGRLGTVMRGAGIAGALAGIALAADQAGRSLDDAAPPVNALTESLLKYLETGKVGGELAKIMGDDFAGLAESIDIANESLLFDPLQSLWFSDTGSSTIREKRAELEALDQVLAGLVQSGQQMAVADFFSRWSEQSGRPVEELEDRFDAYQEAAAGVRIESDRASEGVARVGEAAQGAAPAVEELTDAQKALESALAGFSDPMQLYTDLVRESAEATAEATESSTDSWSDYADSAVVALDRLAERLEEDNRAAVEWQANLVTVAQKHGTEVAQILATMGEEGHRITAQMADDVSGDGARMAAALVENARLGGSEAARQLDAEMQVMAMVGATGGKATVEAIATALQLGTSQVAAIAAQYGVELVAGVNPVLVALGRPGILAGTSGRARHYAKGGMVEPNGYALASGGPEFGSHCPDIVPQHLLEELVAA